MTNATRIGFGIAAALALSAIAVVAGVLLTGAPIWAGLALLAVLDVAIVGGGYWAVRRAVRSGG